MPNLQHILVLCGGQSTEHAVSVLSARNIVERLNPAKYRVSVVLISEEGHPFFYHNVQDFLQSNTTRARQIQWSDIKADCIFSVLHGTHGEDGVMQGLLELLQLPYVGADVLGSAIGMDKDIAKRLMRAADLLVVDWYFVRKIDALTYADASSQFGPMLFVKPNSLGSSVGTQKVSDADSFQAALRNVFLLDDHALVEKAIVGREIECSVLGNENPKASLPGEIINRTEFYSYAAKYLDPNAAIVETPAKLSSSLVARVQAAAIDAFKVLRCSGMARVDFFLSKDEKLYINEINTIPGFTHISMYPKNWEASGLSYSALLDELIALAIQRFHHKKSLMRVYRPETISCQNPLST